MVGLSVNTNIPRCCREGSLLLEALSSKRWKLFAELGIIETTFVSSVTLLCFVDDAN